MGAASRLWDHGVLDLNVLTQPERLSVLAIGRNEVRRLRRLRRARPRSRKQIVLTAQLYYILSLQTLGPLNHLELHQLFFLEGAETLALDGGVVHEDIGAVLLGNESKPLGVVKTTLPFPLLACLSLLRLSHCNPPSRVLRPALQRKKERRQQHRSNFTS